MGHTRLHDRARLLGERGLPGKRGLLGRARDGLRDRAYALLRAAMPLETMSRSARQRLQMLGDAVLFALCVPVALWLQGPEGSGAPGAPGPSGPLEALAAPQFLGVMGAALGALLAAFWRLGLYRAMLRYITGAVLPIILGGVAVSTAIALAGLWALGVAVPWTFALVHALVLVLALGGGRFALRELIRRPGLRDSTPVVIYGAGTSGQQLVAALALGPEYRAVAFVDDDARLHGNTINGVRVHPTTELRGLIARLQVREVLLAMPHLNRMRRRRIVARLERLGVEVKTIPGMHDLIAGRARFTDLRPVTPEDLLGRDPVPPVPALMARNITGKVVMVTGAGGSIGSELCRQIVAQDPALLVMLDVSEYALYAITTELRDAPGIDAARLVPVMGSVQNPGRMLAILQRFGVQTIYHAAAYKHVVLVEENPIEGIHNNVFGTRTLVRAAVRAGVESFTLVSTDKTVRPTNIMGASKRLAELICQAEAQKHGQNGARNGDRNGGGTLFSMVRFGNVLGSSGSVIPRFRDQIDRGGPVTVTHRDVKRYFMTIPESAQLVIQAGAMARGGDVFVLDMGAPVRILDLARSMIRQHGLVPYMVDDTGQVMGESGDIPIVITGLEKGEKLCEELLIGDNPSGTEHPRIMTASERSMPPEALEALLEALLEACQRFDMARIQALLLDAPLAYAPTEDRIHDIVWQTPPASGLPQPGLPGPSKPELPPLRLVQG